MRPSSIALKIGTAFACLALLPVQAPAKTRAKAPVTKACDRQATAVTVEHGITVYRAQPRPWRTTETRPESAPEPVSATRVIIRPYRYNYLAVDTRSRGEWGPVNAVYQKF